MAIFKKKGSPNFFFYSLLLISCMDLKLLAQNLTRCCHFNQLCQLFVSMQNSFKLIFQTPYFTYKEYKLKEIMIKNISIFPMINYYVFLVVLFVIGTVKAQPLVPALFIFGDSVVDAGNNNNLETIVKANFPPYGRDFIEHKSTGRFCNGKLALDYTAENLGFTSYPLAYLNKQAKGKNLLIGANFASGSSGYYDSTAEIYNTISLSKQVELYKDYQKKLATLVGKTNASSIINSSIHFVSAGSSDFIQNYYINPLLYNTYAIDQFSDILLQSYTKFVQELYNLGARKIGVTTLPPLGCVPAVITIFGEDNNNCVEKINRAAILFNNKLNSTSQKLQSNLSNLNLVVLDIYQPLHNLVINPTDYGFLEARKACCGTGLIETSVLCNKKSPGTCKNATEYVFWDGFHPSEAANKVLSDDLLAAGISLVS